jgi:hypothetical protein
VSEAGLRVLAVIRKVRPRLSELLTEKYEI